MDKTSPFSFNWILPEYITTNSSEYSNMVGKHDIHMTEPPPWKKKHGKLCTVTAQIKVLNCKCRLCFCPNSYNRGSFILLTLAKFCQCKKNKKWTQTFSMIWWPWTGCNLIFKLISFIRKYQNNINCITRWSSWASLSSNIVSRGSSFPFFSW